MIKILATYFIGNIITSSFEYRNSHPAVLFPFNSAVIDTRDPGSLTNPAYLPLYDSTYVGSSTDNSYSLEGLYSSGVKAGTSSGSLGMQLSWSRFGINEYSENIYEGNIGYSPLQFLSIGAGFSYYVLDIDTGDLSFGSRLLGYNAALLLLPVKWLNLSFRQDNIRSLVNRERSDLLYPGYSTGLMLKPVKGFSILWNVNKTVFGCINSFSTTANILSFLSIKAGYSKETYTYSAAFTFLIRKAYLSYGLRYHTYLGYTHSVGLTFTDSPAEYDRLDYIHKYSEELTMPVKRININTCSYEELNDIPVLDETASKRIIRYRELIGPVTRKALYQLGLENSEVIRLMRYIYGLSVEEKYDVKKYAEKKKGRYKFSKKKKYFKKKKWRPYRKSRKEIFKKLLGQGLSARLSLALSKIAASGSKEELQRKINSIDNLTPSQRDEIVKLCLK